MFGISSSLLIVCAAATVGAFDHLPPSVGVDVRRAMSELSDEPESHTTGHHSDRLTLVRVRYDSSGGYGESWYSFEGRDWERWETDYPRAERNFSRRLEELTSIEVNREPIAMRLTDPRLFDFPFIYMSDVGWQVLSREERNQLKRYLQRGGFLWVDDFWGVAEWRNLEYNMLQVCPDWTWRELPADHPILHTVYDLDECPQVPARSFYTQSRLSHDPPHVHRYPQGDMETFSRASLRGLFDEEGQMLAIATHNTDIADGWEREGENLEYFERFSVKSYAMGINVLMYAMTR